MRGRALLLQGPLGPFFSLLAEELRDEGHSVFKINFNGGDEVYYRGPGAYAYQGTLAQWGAWLRSFITEHAIDRIFLFGDCRTYHVTARRVAQELDVAVFVFEEGYLRPDYITVEPRGVNGHSLLSRDPRAYADAPPRQKLDKAPAGAGFWPIARHAARYYVAACWRRSRYPHYLHHRPVDLLGEAGRWLLAGARKARYTWADKRLVDRLCKAAHKKLYVVPLQVHCDAQVTHHSRYHTVEEFIAEVVGSFAANAPADTSLVFKHHPLDRAYHDYRSIISRLTRQYRIEARVNYLVDGHLPTLLRSAAGVVVINSTVGLSAIHHGVPVKVMGDAIYDIAGLTSKAGLDEFWRDPGEVDAGLYKRFRYHLVNHVLGNGSFYRRARTDAGATGVAWPFGSLTAASAPARAALPRHETPVTLPSNVVLLSPLTSGDGKHNAQRGKGETSRARKSHLTPASQRPGFAVSLMPRRRVVEVGAVEMVQTILAHQRSAQDERQTQE